MSELKATPGPWLFHAHNGEITDSSPAENRIADVQLEDWHKLGAGYANAHLIAAAPDGYALAKLVMEICGNPKGISERDQEELYEAALQYANKARGEA